MAQCLNNLAVIYCRQEKYAEAKPASYGRAVAIWEKALGPKHPNVAQCLKSYAILLRVMGRPEEAASLKEARAEAIQGKSA